MLTLAVELDLRNRSQLNQTIGETADPHSLQYRQRLTQDQFNQTYGPTVDQTKRVTTWLQSHRFTITQTFPNRLLFMVQGQAQQAESMLSVTINDYQQVVSGRTITFYAPDREPAVDGSVSDTVVSIVGLDDYAHVLAQAFPGADENSNGTTSGGKPYNPQDLGNAYDLNPLWGTNNNGPGTGSGQHIGVVSDQGPPADGTLEQWSVGGQGTIGTGANYPMRTNGRFQAYVSGGSSWPASGTEAALDVEAAAGMAPNATIDFYAMSGGFSDASAEAALNQAGTDANNNWQIVVTWSYLQSNLTFCEVPMTATAPYQPDAFESATENILEANAATGHDYIVASGDLGDNQNCGPNSPYFSDPEFPASSPYVTAVGGTEFTTPIGSSYPGNEDALDDSSFTSGGGFSWLFSMPTWQQDFLGASGGCPRVRSPEQAIHSAHQRRAETSLTLR